MDVEWVEFIIKLGAIASAATGVGKVLVVIYNKTITGPRNRLTERIQKESSMQLERSINPLTVAIDKLNYLLEDSKMDRRMLHDKNKEQDSKIQNHENRIVVLEDRHEVKK